MMNRRTWIKTGGLAALSAGLTGCATSQAARRAPVAAPVNPPAAARRTIELPLIDASWDRVIRTTVGLRPHRDSGFVLKAEKFDAKTVIHNFGHGGAGMSISWGTGLIASDLALTHTERRAAVIGCGAVGLTSARQLQRRGFDVTIYAMALPPDTTSNMSLAGFTPTSGLVEPSRRTPEWDAQFRRAAEIGYRQLQLLARPKYGISWIYSYNPTDQLPQPGRGGGEGGADLLPPQLRTGQAVFEAGEHPFPTKYVIRRAAMRIEPSIYLDALVEDFRLFGGKIVIRKFDSPRDLMSLEETVIVNCTGLGAKAIFGDEELVPVKGQLTHFIPQPEINYQTAGGAPANAGPVGGGGIGIHMMPRSDGLAMGGTAERGVWSLEPNEEARKRVVDQHIQLYTSMRPPSAGNTRQAARLDLPTDIPKLESFFDLEF